MQFASKKLADNLNITGIDINVILTAKNGTNQIAVTNVEFKIANPLDVVKYNIKAFTCEGKFGSF